ncbi:hypothetical protein [Sinimarinibacterium flocculans]|uniref:Uncharacterized protein n=1 Tax=Sinimarinibacterium flocculans TaxID=985250 RepID=A0A318E6Y9_9GAMM|nr:hypothetical protein [Sinimarinibacterium flocculans]PXV67252.1 hypothetical protein C8D93_106230 [Sinimarinibacterium flocculans]
MSVLHGSLEDEIADRYFSFANDVIGVLGVSLAATALQFERPPPFAAIFFAVLFVWTFSKGGEYRRIAKRYVVRYRGFVGMLLLLWRLNIYLTGFALLFLVMSGSLTKEVIYAAWPW